MTRVEIKPVVDNQLEAVIEPEKLSAVITPTSASGRVMAVEADINFRESGCTSGGGGVPGFFIIGAMKSGTTSLFEMLKRHPKVFMCEPKEPKYFSHPEVYQRGGGWYKSLFDGADEGQLCGEASTCYSRWPHFGDVAGQIYQNAPDAKLIYIMRHPVERAYSHYGHEMRHGVKMSFEQALEADRAIIDTSTYIMQIEQYLRWFEREQMLLLTLDDLKNNAADVARQVQRFLGIDELEIVDHKKPVGNYGGKGAARVRIINRLKDFRRKPGVSQVADICTPRFRKRIYSLLLEKMVESKRGRALAYDYKQSLPQLRPETRIRLLETFASATRELELFTGKDLSRWYI